MESVIIRPSLKVGYEMLIRIFLFIILTPLFTFAPAHAAVKPDVVKLWTYYNFKPFLQSNEKQGLIIDLAEMLTANSQGQFNFVVKYLPRKRIDMLLTSHQLGAVALVNPHWFPETFMASSPLLNGNDIIISSKHNIINDVYGTNLKYQRFIGVVGHKYPALLDVTIANRQNISSIDSLFKLIAKQRGDFAIVPSLVAAYHQVNDEYSSKIHFGPQFRAPYTRHLVMAKKHNKLKQFVDKFFASSTGQQQWENILERYHLTNLAVKPLH